MLYRIELLLAYLLYFTGIYWLYRRRLERRGAAVVLVYHRVLSGDRGIGEMVGEREFDWQMRYLAQNAKPGDWKQIAAAPRGTPGIRVLVTFDDGYRDNFTRAQPILERARVPAVFFVVTKFVFEGRRIELDESADEEDIFPTPGELDAAAASPVVTYGNHTDSHRLVARMTEEELDGELSTSQRQFQDRWGKSPDTFAYPRGRKEDIADRAAVLRRNGIDAAFTMVPGLLDLESDDPYQLPRIGVSHVNDRVLFRVKSIGLLVPFVKARNLLAR